MQTHFLKLQLEKGIARGRSDETNSAPSLLPALLFLINWKHNAHCESSLRFILLLFCSKSQSTGSSDNSPARCAARAAGTASSMGWKGEAAFSAAGDPTSPFFPHPLLHVDRVQLPDLMRLFCRTETAAYWSQAPGAASPHCRPQMPSPCPARAPRGGTPPPCYCCLPLLVKSPQFPHPMAAIRLVSFFAGKYHRESGATNSSAD